MLSNISYNAYSSSARGIQNKSQNVNFGSQLNKETAKLGEDLVTKLLELTGGKPDQKQVVNILEILGMLRGRTQLDSLRHAATESNAYGKMVQEVNAAK